MSPTTSSTLTRKSHHVGAVPAWHPRAVNIPRHAHTFAGRQCSIAPRRALLLIPALPVIGLLGLLVRLTSPGPAIYRQLRVGQRGRKFMMYKIRTMRHNAEAQSGPMWTQTGDPRMTRIGEQLRRFHLDELPQLLNVLKGEMSLVGPRPERPEFVHILLDAVPGYANRLAVPPGVTGLAQLNLPPDTDLSSVQRKLVLDREYIDRAGVLLDIRLVLCTALRMFKVPEGWLLPMLGLGRTVTLPTNPEAASGNGSDAAGHTAGGTPASILVEAAAASVEGNGGHRGRHRHADKRSHDGNGHSKPR